MPSIQNPGNSRSLCQQLLPLLAIALLATAIACKPSRQFPPVKPLASMPATVFQATLEDSLPSGKNAIYAASLLYAWDKLRDTLGGSISIDPAFSELNLINTSTSYQQTLAKEDINTSAIIADNLVIAKADFSKSLHFKDKFIKQSTPLLFLGKPVRSFGFSANDKELAKQVNILWYRSNEEFAVRLNFTDTADEAILFKTPDLGFTSLSQLISELNARCEDGRIKAAEAATSMDYFFSGDDRVEIPNLAFNLEASFDKLVGTPFLAATNPYKIKSVTQRTALLLDEAGAEVESEAEIVAAATAIPPVRVNRTKTLLFNKPFLLVLKRRSCSMPYFAAWITNTELLHRVH